MPQRFSDQQRRLLNRPLNFLFGATMGSQMEKPLLLTMKAVPFATKCHQDEKREDGIPYIWHSAMTCYTLVNLKVHYDPFLAASILHDVVENGHTDLETIDREFREEVRNLVDCQTKRPGETPEEYYRRVASEIGAILGKGADRYHNISNMIGIFDLPRLERYVDETDQYVLPMLEDARYIYQEYSSALVMLHDSIVNIVRVAKHYIEMAKQNAELAKRNEELSMICAELKAAAKPTAA